jgi:hypothetical protein
LFGDLRGLLTQSGPGLFRQMGNGALLFAAAAAFLMLRRAASLCFLLGMSRSFPLN